MARELKAPLARQEDKMNIFEQDLENLRQQVQSGEIAIETAFETLAEWYLVLAKEFMEEEG